jgi:hypothetical protein
VLKIKQLQWFGVRPTLSETFSGLASSRCLHLSPSSCRVPSACLQTLLFYFPLIVIWRSQLYAFHNSDAPASGRPVYDRRICPVFYWTRDDFQLARRWTSAIARLILPHLVLLNASLTLRRHAQRAKERLVMRTQVFVQLKEELKLSSSLGRP